MRPTSAVTLLACLALAACATPRTADVRLPAAFEKPGPVTDGPTATPLGALAAAPAAGAPHSRAMLRPGSPPPEKSDTIVHRVPYQLTLYNIRSFFMRGGPSWP